MFIGGPIVAIRFDYLRDRRQVSLQATSLFAERRSFARQMFMRPTWLAGVALAAALPACAQYPGQVKANQQSPTMRAVAVLEWTGDQEHPKASRLVPVSVYDGDQLQDGGIYLARPAPLALSSEVEYELKDNGKTVGLFDVNSAGQEQGAWVGFGVWKPLPKPKPPAQAAKMGNRDVWGNEDDDRPVLHRKQHTDDKQGSAKDSSGNSGSAAPSADPDRPTLHKKSSGDDSNNSSTGSNPAPDPDRPTLKKKTEQPKPVADQAYVESMKSVTDPNRPRLLRGKPADQGGTVLPTLMGLPPDMHQAVAVSDAINRPEHIWSYSWANPEDEAKMKAAMEDIARQALGLTPATPSTPPAAHKTKTTGSAVHRKTMQAPASPPPPAPLVNEQFRVFELAYGSGATMVLSARTDGVGAQQKFVTLICQPDLYGNVAVLLKNVTDAAHLDDTPRMRLVDAVDALADNRGELLFELRGATQRQFALYRVLRGQVSKLFASGPGGIAPQISETVAQPHS